MFTRVELLDSECSGECIRFNVMCIFLNFYFFIPLRYPDKFHENAPVFKFVHTFWELLLFARGALRANS